MLLFTPGNMLQLFRERRAWGNPGKVDMTDSRCIGGTENPRDIPRVLDILQDNPNILASFPHMLKKLLSLFFPELPHDDLRIRDIARNVNSQYKFSASIIQYIALLCIFRYRIYTVHCHKLRGYFIISPGLYKACEHSSCSSWNNLINISICWDLS